MGVKKLIRGSWRRMNEGGIKPNKQDGSSENRIKIIKVSWRFIRALRQVFTN